MVVETPRLPGVGEEEEEEDESSSSSSSENSSADIDGRGGSSSEQEEGEEERCGRRPCGWVGLGGGGEWLDREGRWTFPWDATRLR